MGVPGGKEQEVCALGGGCPCLHNGQKSQLVEQMKEAKEPRAAAPTKELSGGGGANPNKTQGLGPWWREAKSDPD